MIKTIAKALEIAIQAHKGQTDKAGQPYIIHPITVALSQESEEAFVAAILHDVVEDSDYSIEDIASSGFSSEVVEAVRVLTHEKSVEYGEYIEAIRGNEIARSVKIADLMHNSDLSRLSVVTEKDIERCEKYKKSLRYLKDGIKEN